MPIRVSYPGVYVEEIPGGQPVTSGVSTASTAFVDFFSKGPMNQAVRVASMADFNRIFGGLHLQSESSYGLKQYFLNGGQEAWVVRAGDGTAASALLDVRVETPGLAARYSWALDSEGLAKTAKKAAEDAATAAKKTFKKIDPSAAAQQLEQLSKQLRDETTGAADETRKATAATRDAAIQAKASSDELAIAIARLAAAAGPVASRTMKAAQHTADAAAASSEAATQNKDVIGAAQEAVALAKAALGQGKIARTVLGTSQDLLAVLKAIEATQAAVNATQAHNKAAKEAGDLTAASQAAMEAAGSAEEAAEQAAVAVRGAQAVLETLGVTPKADGDELQKALAALVELDMKTPAEEAAKAGLTAQTAVDTDDAKAAAKAALLALKTIAPQSSGESVDDSLLNLSLESVENGAPPEENTEKGSQDACRQAAVLAQAALQQMAKKVAMDAAGVAGRAGIEGGMEETAVSEAKGKLETANLQLTLADVAVGLVKQQKAAVEPDANGVHDAAQKATKLAVQAATDTQTAVGALKRLLEGIKKANLDAVDQPNLETQQKAVGENLSPKPDSAVTDAEAAEQKITPASTDNSVTKNKAAADGALAAANKVQTIVTACTTAIDKVLAFTFVQGFDSGPLKEKLGESKAKLEALGLAAGRVKDEKEKADPDNNTVKAFALVAIAQAQNAAAAAKSAADEINGVLGSIPGDHVVQKAHKKALKDAKTAIGELGFTPKDVNTEADGLRGDDTNAVNKAAQTAGKVEDITTAYQEALNAAEAVLQTVFTGKVVADANLAILGATSATKAALVAAKLASTDAKVAASTVGSAAVTLAAREAVSGTEKAGTRTAAALKQSKAVIAQLNKALVTSLQSVKPAKEAADKIPAASIGSNDEGGAAETASLAEVQKAVDAAQAALNAANNALAAAEAVEKATVEVSKLTYEATVSADLAARSAKVAVDANEEAGRPPTLRIAAANEGIWGDNIQVDIEVEGAEFSMLVSEFISERGVTRRVAQESYNLLNLEKDDKRFAVEILNEQSQLVRLDYIGPMVTGAYPDKVDGQFLSGGNDGGLADASQLTGADGALMALEDIQPFIFNLLCLPSVGSMPGGQASVAIANAQAYCAKKRAFFIVDIPAEVDDADKMLDWVDEYGNAQAYHMAVYFPRLVIPDPLQDFRPRNVGPSGTLAGVYARTDNQRGVWKAPAGINAVLQGAEVVRKITDDQNGLLNPRGVNVLRSFPVYGNISWGARTLAGADAISSEWKYLNVRRLFNYVEESLFQSLKWAVFEPNDEELWSKIRMQVATFLAGLFSQGAFQGSGEGSSYFVVCDGTTTTPVDIDLGVVNVDIGIAPSKPAEFVVLHFQQIAGQAA